MSNPDLRLVLTEVDQQFAQVGGEDFSEVIVEVARAGATEPEWVHKIRRLVIRDQNGRPECPALRRITAPVPDRKGTQLCGVRQRKLIHTSSVTRAWADYGMVAGSVLSPAPLAARPTNDATLFGS